MEISARLVSYQDVFKCVHMCILSQAAAMHKTAWAVLMFPTVAKREEKTKQSTNLFFCV